MKMLPLSSMALVAMMFSMSAVAQQGGFSGPGAAPKQDANGSKAISTVSEALKQEDDTPIILQGNITRQLSHEYYEFKDASNKTITVEIDDDDWEGIQVTPQDKVQLEGEVERHRDGRIDVDVDRVTLIK